MKGFKIYSTIISIFFTIILIFLSLISKLEYQDLLLWGSIDIIIFNWYINIYLFSFIHIIVGSLIFAVSFYQCLEIVKINNQAHETKNHPKVILDHGYYAKVRHPMTTRFILIILSFFFILSSLIGIPLIFFFILIFFLITLYEEKKIIIPVFGEKYKEYMKKVKNRYFILKLKIFVVFLIAFMILGAIFV